MAHTTASATMRAMVFEQLGRPLRADKRAISPREPGQVLPRDLGAGAAVLVRQ
jgi:hypothetical protein